MVAEGADEPPANWWTSVPATIPTRPEGRTLRKRCAASMAATVATPTARPTPPDAPE